MKIFLVLLNDSYVFGAHTYEDQYFEDLEAKGEEYVEEKNDKEEYSYKDIFVPGFLGTIAAVSIGEAEIEAAEVFNIPRKALEIVELEDIGYIQTLAIDDKGNESVMRNIKVDSESPNIIKRPVLVKSFKYIKEHNNYDLTVGIKYEGRVYKKGWIEILKDDKGSRVLYREEYFEVEEKKIEE